MESTQNRLERVRMGEFYSKTCLRQPSNQFTVTSELLDEHACGDRDEQQSNNITRNKEEDDTIAAVSEIHTDADAVKRKY